MLSYLATWLTNIANWLTDMCDRTKAAEYREPYDARNAARSHVMTPEEQREQRISFAYGNANIDNPRVTREMVERAAEDAETVARERARWMVEKSGRSN